MKLGVLLEQGGSMASMRRSGQEARLLYYFDRYREAFDHVVFFSYGDEGAREAGRSRLVARNPALPPSLYSFALPFVHGGELASCNVLRVLQTSAAIPAAITKKRFGVPFVVTYGYDAVKLEGRFLSRPNAWIAARLADVTVCTTAALREQVRERNPPGAVELLPNGVDLRLFLPRDVRTSPDGAWKILSVGRLSPEKNYPLLIDAAARLDNVEVHLVGAGPEASSLAEHAGRTGVALELHGTVAQSDLPALYDASDLFVLTSRSEGHPKALLEAMASRRPCVGTNVPGIRDVLSHRTTGLIVDESPDALSDALSELLRDRTLASRLADAARAEAETSYALDRLLDRELEILTGIGGKTLTTRTP